MAQMHLAQADADRVYDRMTKADASDLNRQITGMRILRFCGAFLGIVFLAVNSYQAVWALMKLSGAASGGSGIYGGESVLTGDQWTLGATAFGLIFAAQVIAVRMVLANGAWRFFGVLLLAGLMAFSTLTSAIHIGFNIQGGVVEATRQSDDYTLAKSRYEAAIASMKTSEQNWTNYQNNNRGGDPWALNATHSKGPGRPFVEGIKSAKAEVEDARRAFKEVKESGGGSAMGDVVGAVAGWFNMNTADFALAFGIFTVVLMEAVRVYLSLLTGMYLMQVMNEISAKRQKGSDKDAEKATDDGAGVEDDKAKAQSAQRSQVMASSAPHATDTIRGPVLRDPIEVEGDTSKGRAMFAPRKPVQRSEPADTVPGNKRQVAYSKKLAKVKRAVETGKVKPGDKLTGDVVKGLAGGGARDTVAALRNDLATAGVAHWRGSRLIAGAA